MLFCFVEDVFNIEMVHSLAVADDGQQLLSSSGDGHVLKGICWLWNAYWNVPM